MVNNLHLISGNVGKDPELKTFGDDKKVVRFSIAVSEGYGEKKTTQWFNVAAFGQLAETISRFVKKGQELTVIGRGTQREYEKDGVKKMTYEITANDIQFHGKKEEKPESKLGRTTAPDDDDNAPF
jgi:single-strand DNA-binding protein